MRKNVKRKFKNKNIKLWLVIGMLKNKNLYDYLKKINPILIGIIAIKIPDEINSFSTSEIVTICKELKIKSYSKTSINKVNEFLAKEIKPKNVLISGSLYLVGKIRKLYL